MKNNIPNNNRERLKIVESALFNGIENASKYFNINIKLIEKWIKSIESIKVKAEKEIIRHSLAMKKQYQTLSPEKKKLKNKHKAENHKRYYRKHNFLTLLKNLKKNLKTKGYDHQLKFTAFDLWCLAKRQKLKCAISGIKLTADNLSIDHIIPLSRGGSSDLSNLQIVDKNVNLIKSTMTVDELLKFCKIILKKNGFNCDKKNFE